MEGVSREIRLVARPRGFPDEELFELAETPIPDPGDGQLLVRNAYFSVDPYMRPRMNDVRSYVAPFTLGEAMTGGAVGQVAASRQSELRGGRLGHPPARLARVGALGRLTACARSTRGQRRSRPPSASSGCRDSPRTTGSSSWVSRSRARRSSSRERRVRSAAPPGRWRRSPGCTRARLRRLRGEGRLAPRARLRPRVRLSREHAARRRRDGDARRHRHLLRQRRRRPARGRDRRAARRAGGSSRAARSPATTTSRPRPARATCSWS